MCLPNALRNSWILCALEISLFPTVLSDYRVMSSRRTFDPFLPSSFKNHERMTSRRQETRMRRNYFFIYNVCVDMCACLIGFFFLIISLCDSLGGASMTGVLQLAAWKSIVDRHFFDATSLQRSIPVQTFAVRDLSLCVLLTLFHYTQVSWEGPRTGRYT